MMYYRRIKRVDEAIIFTVNGAKKLYNDILNNSVLFQYNFNHNKNFVKFLCENLDIHLSMNDNYNLIPAKEYVKKLIEDNDDYIINIMSAIANTRAMYYKNLIFSGLKGFLLVDDDKKTVVMDNSDHFDYICASLKVICQGNHLEGRITKDSMKTYQISSWFKKVP